MKKLSLLLTASVFATASFSAEEKDGYDSDGRYYVNRGEGNIYSEQDPSIAVVRSESKDDSSNSNDLEITSEAVAAPALNFNVNELPSVFFHPIPNVTNRVRDEDLINILIAEGQISAFMEYSEKYSNSDVKNFLIKINSILVGTDHDMIIKSNKLSDEIIDVFNKGKEIFVNAHKKAPADAIIELKNYNILLEFFAKKNDYLMSDSVINSINVKLTECSASIDALKEKEPTLKKLNENKRSAPSDSVTSSLNMDYLNSFFKNENEAITTINTLSARISTVLSSRNELISDLEKPINYNNSKKIELTNTFYEIFQDELWLLLRSLHLGDKYVEPDKAAALLQDTVVSMQDYLENKKINSAELLDLSSIAMHFFEDEKDDKENLLFIKTLSIISDFMDNINDDKMFNIKAEVCNVLNNINIFEKRRIHVALGTCYILDMLGFSTTPAVLALPSFNPEKKLRLDVDVFSTNIQQPESEKHVPNTTLDIEKLIRKMKEIIFNPTAGQSTAISDHKYSIDELLMAFSPAQQTEFAAYCEKYPDGDVASFLVKTTDYMSNNDEVYAVQLRIADEYTKFYDKMMQDMKNVYDIQSVMTVYEKAEALQSIHNDLSAFIKVNEKILSEFFINQFNPILNILAFRIQEEKALINMVTSSSSSSSSQENAPSPMDVTINSQEIIANQEALINFLTVTDLSALSEMNSENHVPNTTLDIEKLIRKMKEISFNPSAGQSTAISGHEYSIDELFMAFSPVQNAAFDAYCEKYPDGDVVSFLVKKTDYMINNTEVSAGKLRIIEECNKIFIKLSQDMKNIDDNQSIMNIYEKGDALQDVHNYMSAFIKDNGKILPEFFINEFNPILSMLAFRIQEVKDLTNTVTSSSSSSSSSSQENAPSPMDVTINSQEIIANQEVLIDFLTITDLSALSDVRVVYNQIAEDCNKIKNSGMNSDKKMKKYQEIIEYIRKVRDETANGRTLLPKVVFPALNKKIVGVEKIIQEIN